MLISRPGDPGGPVRRWVNRSLLFAESGIANYELPLRSFGFGVGDLRQFQNGITEFLAGHELNDATFCLAMELLGALSSWFDENEHIANQTDREVVSFLFECLMDGQITSSAANHAQSPFAAASGF